RDLLHFARGPDHHRELAAPLQHDQAPRIAQIQTASTGGIRPYLRRVAGCATPTGSAAHAGETANLKLTFHLDHAPGADHRHGRGWLIVIRMLKKVTPRSSSNSRFSPNSSP